MSNSDYCSILEALWTGESVWCKCGHHVNCHYTNISELVKMGRIATCIFETTEGSCKCKEFRPYKTVKLTATNGIDIQEYKKEQAFINLVKIKFDEPLDWEPNDVSPDTMKVIPVNFGKEHKELLSHLHVVISKGYLGISSQHDKLITSLRTAYANELSLDKGQTSYDDSLDALRLSLKGYTVA